MCEGYDREYDSGGRNKGYVEEKERGTSESYTFDLCE